MASRGGDFFCPSPSRHHSHHGGAICVSRDGERSFCFCGGERLVWCNRCRHLWRRTDGGIWAACRPYGGCQSGGNSALLRPSPHRLIPDWSHHRGWQGRRLWQGRSAGCRPSSATCVSGGTSCSLLILIFAVFSAHNARQTPCGHGDSSHGRTRKLKLVLTLQQVEVLKKS